MITKWHCINKLPQGILAKLLIMHSMLSTKKNVPSILSPYIGGILECLLLDSNGLTTTWDLSLHHMRVNGHMSRLQPQWCMHIFPPLIYLVSLSWSLGRWACWLFLKSVSNWNREWLWENDEKQRDIKEKGLKETFLLWEVAFSKIPEK